MFYIYKIKNLNYIGSTSDIKRRTQHHKTKCFNKNLRYYNFLVYQYIREKKINIELEILFCYKKKCSFKIQRLIEQYYINKHDSVNNGLNTNNAFTNNIKGNRESSRKYIKKNKEKIKEYKKKYREKNKEFINQKIICSVCNCLTSKLNIKRHQKTKKCKNSI